jgi:Icc-related predicted phosphoesterase
MRIVCLSDTHGRHDQVRVPEGDLLIHAGDLTRKGHIGELQDFADWVHALPHKHKVVIAGNHDLCCEQTPGQTRDILVRDGTQYLQDSGCTWHGLKIWGSPWTPEFGRWSFMRPRGELVDIWKKIPFNTDILITHGPAAGIRDITIAQQHAGCGELSNRMWSLRLRLHVFGHVHEAAGTAEVGFTSVNASICNLGLQPVYQPIVVEWDGEEMKVVDDA